MFAFATVELVGNAYDVFLYTGGYVAEWGYSRAHAFYGLNLAAAISFALAVLLQDGMLVSCVVETLICARKADAPTKGLSTIRYLEL